MKSLNYTLMASVALAHTSSFAAPYDEFYTKSSQECVNKSGGITINLTNCNNQDWEYLEPKMRFEVNRIKSRLSPDGKRRFDRDQKSWFHRIDEGCYTPDVPYQGTADILGHGACINDETIKRIKWLRARYPHR